METEEIYSLTISPPIISKFAVEWSEDNHISILTEKGIHIFEFIPSPMSPYGTIKFSRSFIYAPSTFPTEMISNKIEPKIWNMHREAIYSLIMEESLTPKLSNVREMVPKIVYFSWSPQNLIHPSKCLLAILTSAGAIMIVYKISTDWYPAYDLSSMRYNTMEKEINRKLKDKKNNPISFITLKTCIKALQASCFTWSKLFIDFAYFAVAYHNGDIIIYKIPKLSDYKEILSPKIMGTIRLNECIKINTLHWISTNDTKEFLIIIGYLDGRIYGLKIRDHNQSLELKSTEKYYDYADRIPISVIRTFAQTDGTQKSMQYLQLEGFMISGMTCISADYALATTENGAMFAINTQKNYLSKIKVKNRLSQIHVRCLGLARSLSSVIFINITSPSTTYDHLLLKEPSKICMFGLKDKNWDPLFVLKETKHERFDQLWDCLEVIRIKAAKASEPSTVLPKVPSNLESLSLHELRITMWISVMMEICKKKQVIQGVGSIAGEISEAQPLIFVHIACNYLMHLESKSSLLEEHKLSINLLRMYLEVYLAGEENEEASFLTKCARDVLNKTSYLNQNKIETCNLCGEIINDLAWKVAMCPQGHILPRCAITLLQITSVQYGTCPICGLIFHSCLDQEFKETRCLFCDVPALQENRVLDTKCYIPKEKSLSKPQSHIPEVPEDREMETIADESSNV
ncbi:hypothetical protein WH47_00114 [Habropoda laboriosa]|uniref:Transcription factor IIIC 90kDa subunit N-terminal domain-containing protein n=1 Tax=Habropoda laboriosa TaxID=597456 RepID=A0A0L7R8S3_9HYME|nr:hypothetical protein WH47_00114 [Habropoda laboriosa]